jgi:hypothetical protein
MFLRSLSAKLRLGYPKTGVYKALGEAAKTGLEEFFIIFTDLQVNNAALLEAISIQRQRFRIIVAQIGAAWRLSLGLEGAYREYQKNSQIIQRLQHFGLTTFDLRSERLVENITREIVRSGLVASA